MKRCLNLFLALSSLLLCGCGTASTSKKTVLTLQIDSADYTVEDLNGNAVNEIVSGEEYLFDFDFGYSFTSFAEDWPLSFTVGLKYGEILSLDEGNSANCEMNNNVPKLTYTAAENKPGDFKGVLRFVSCYDLAFSDIPYYFAEVTVGGISKQNVTFKADNPKISFNTEHSKHHYYYSNTNQKIICSACGKEVTVTNDYAKEQISKIKYSLETTDKNYNTKVVFYDADDTIIAKSDYYYNLDFYIYVGNDCTVVQNSVTDVDTDYKTYLKLTETGTNGKYITEKDYDENGNLIKYYGHYADGNSNSTTETYEYDDNGNLIKKTESNGEGTSVYTYEYDENSNLIHSYSKSKYGKVEESNYTFDENQNLIHEDYYITGPDISKRSYDFTYSYDENSILTQEDCNYVNYYDEDELSLSYRYYYTYDEKGRILTKYIVPQDLKVKTEKTDGNGNKEYYLYSENSHVSSVFAIYDYQNDTYSYTEIVTNRFYSYDEEGTAPILEAGDDLLNDYTTTTYDYNDRELELSYYFYGALYNHEDCKYDSNGNLLYKYSTYYGETLRRTVV